MDEKTLKYNKKNFPPVVLAIAGFDPTGSAGILADARVICHQGCHPCGIATCNTVQTSEGVTGIIPVPAKILAEQMYVFLQDITPDIVKIGALASEETIKVIAAALESIPDVPVVLDPVFSPTNGPAFLGKNHLERFCEYILPKAYIVTPNLDELGTLAGGDVDQSDDENIADAAGIWLAMGTEHVLVTGIRRGDKIVNRLFNININGSLVSEDFTHEFYERGEVHGTGCVLSSFIATYLAIGRKTSDSVNLATAQTGNLIKNAKRLGKGAFFWEFI